MSAKMVLDTWKWRFHWLLRIFSMSVENDFRQPPWKSRKPPFPMFSISTPYGGTACVGRRRPAQAAGRPVRLMLARNSA
jgi:hypothetical protein